MHNHDTLFQTLNVLMQKNIQTTIFWVHKDHLTSCFHDLLHNSQQLTKQADFDSFLNQGHLITPNSNPKFQMSPNMIKIICMHLFWSNNQ